MEAGPRLPGAEAARLTEVDEELRAAGQTEGQGLSGPKVAPASWSWDEPEPWAPFAASRAHAMKHSEPQQQGGAGAGRNAASGLVARVRTKPKMPRQRRAKRG